MSFTNEPTPETGFDADAPKQPIKTDQDKKKWSSSLIAALAIIIIPLAAYLIFNKTTTNDQMHETEETMTGVMNQKSIVQSGFDASLARLDSMVSVNSYLNESLQEKNAEITTMKEQIRSILNKKDADAADLAKVQTLIANLNEKISDLRNEVTRLQSENKLLSAELMASHTIRDSLVAKVDLASTLNASNIKITPVNVKRNGKERVSTSAKKVDKLIVSFDVRNRIIQSGNTDLYVIVLGPDGIPVKSGASATGRFTTREEGEQTYTAKVPVALETAVNKNVAFSFVPGEDFKKGSYSVKIYQNGFLIGEAVQTLRKGGLFG